MNPKKGIWEILHGKKIKPADDNGPTWIIGGVLILIGLIILMIFGD